MTPFASATVQMRPATDVDNGNNRGQTPPAAVADKPRWQLPDLIRRGAAAVRRVATGEIPSLWSAGPATGPQLLAYGRRGEWCNPDSQILRALGMAWCFVVAIPLSMAAYLAAWALQRPGRGAALALLALVVWILL